MIAQRIIAASNVDGSQDFDPSEPDWEPIEVFIAELEERWFWRAVEQDLEDFVRATWREVR